MNCEKTGCVLYLSQYHQYAYGDSFILGGARVFRIVEVSSTLDRDFVNYTIFEIDHWFDKNSLGHPSTMISNSFIYHGYSADKKGDF